MTNVIASALQQLQREKAMLTDGHDRYMERQANLKDLSIDKVHSRLLLNAIPAVAADIEQELKTAQDAHNRPFNWVKDIEGIDSELLAYAGLVCCMEAVGQQATRTKALNHIGGRIEMEHFAKGLYEFDKGLAERITNLVNLRNSGNQQRKTAIRHMAGVEGYKPQKWTQERCKQAATPVFNAVMRASGIFEEWTQTKGVKTIQRMGLTEEASEDIAKVNLQLSWNSPVFTPMITEPQPWVDVDNGCYLDPSLGHMTPLVRRASPKQMRMIRSAIRSGRMQPALDAINIIQNVPWRINEYVLSAVEWAWEEGLQPDKSFPMRNHLPVPPMPDNYEELSDKQKKAARAKSAAVRFLNRRCDGDRSNMASDLQQARDLRNYDQFWQPYSFDFRGRIYPIANFNSQRGDHIKSLFTLANAKPLGKTGPYWLAIHVANTGDFDKVSKKSFEARVQWVMDNIDRLVEIGHDFEGTYAGDEDKLYWSDADKPFAFLAACRELRGFWINGEDYVCGLPCNLDGSNSGVQHFSAASRTYEDAKLVCLVPMDEPQDIYRAVADYTNKLLVERLGQEKDADTRQAIEEWLEHGIGRKECKRNTMCYGYSSEVYGFTDQIMEDFMAPLRNKVTAGEIKKHPFTKPHLAARILAETNWKSITTVIVGASKGMAFFQNMAEICGKLNETVSWFTPVGFPVDNSYYKTKAKRLRLYLYDKEAKMNRRSSVTLNVDDYKTVNTRKCASAISPNVIHSMDSSHLMSTVLKGAERGITDWMLIHDSFGTVPADTQKLFDVVREAFVEQYQDRCIYTELAQQTVEQLRYKGHEVEDGLFGSVPDKGDLDIQAIKESLYCFA